MKISASMTQRQHWFSHQLSPNSTAYSIPVAVHLKGVLDEELLCHCIEQTVQAHPAFRTRFAWEQSELLQIVEPVQAVAVPVISLKEDYSEESFQNTKQLAKDVAKPFDLENDLLVRFALYRFTDKSHVLLTVMHHAISDLQTIALFFEELAERYNGDAPKISKTTYTDYTQKQQKWFDSKEYARMVDFWLKELSAIDHSPAMPTDFKRPAAMGLEGREQQLPVTRQQSDDLQKMSKQLRVNDFTLLLSAFYLVLHRYSSRKHIAVGVPFTNRRQPDAERMAGNFANILPLVSPLEKGMTFEELVKKVRAMLLMAHRNQEVPMEHIVNRLQIKREASYNALYQVGFTLEPQISFPLRDIQSRRVHIQKGSSQLDMYAFFRYDEDRKLCGYIEYDNALFRHDTMAMFAEDYCAIISEAIADPSRKIEALIEDCRGAGKNTSKEDGGGEKRKQNFPVYVTGTFTTDPVLPVFDFWVNTLNWPLQVTSAGYNQTFQQLLDHGSLFSANQTGYNICLLRIDDWLPKENGKPTFPANGDFTECRETVSQFIDVFRSALLTNQAYYVLALCPPSPHLMKKANARNAFASMEADIISALQKAQRVTIVFWDEVTTFYPVKDYYEEMGEQLGHLPYTKSFFVALGTAIIRKIGANFRLPYKAVIADCDGTLWNGVVGEDGWRGIDIDSGFRQIQNMLVSCTKKGMLLCLCSKNEQTDVMDVLHKRKDMTIRPEHIAAYRINWEPKSENIRQLAHSLNIGTDSMVFIDDNPVECAEVQAQLPEVLTICVPRESKKAAAMLRHLWALDFTKGTATDRKRAQMYKDEIKRTELREKTVSFADFLQQLRMTVSISPPEPSDIARISQLSIRTNQFNFMTERMNESQVEAILGSSDMGCRIIEVSDRFGDYGIVGVLMWKIDEDSLIVTNLFLSCRALGRGVEHRMIAHAGEFAKKRGLPAVNFLFKESERNEPARNFLMSNFAGFCMEGSVPVSFRVPADQAASLSFQPSVYEQKNAPKPKRGSPPPKRYTTNKQMISVMQTLRDVESIEAAMREKSGIENDRHPRRNNKTEDPSLSSVQAVLKEIWGEVLGKRSIDLNENFFDIGGSSILLPWVAIQIKKKLNLDISLVQLFQYTSIKQLASFISSSFGFHATANLNESLTSSDGDRITEPDSQVNMNDSAVCIKNSISDGNLGRCVAIIGMAGRFPKANSVRQFWENLTLGVDCCEIVGDEELRNMGVPQQLLDDPACVKRAGVVKDIDLFDAAFFGYSPREAELIDPQHRLLLECAWEAIEDAGYVPEGVNGAVGVFAGAGIDYYLMKNILSQPKSTEEILDFLTCIGNDKDYLCSRISYKLGFNGPSYVVQSACSTSLVAVQLGYQALLTSQCDMALCGGVALQSPRARAYLYKEGEIFSKDGTCRTFDKDAGGMVFGEGVGLVVLKRLEDAVADHDHIYSVIRGAVVNNDGAAKAGYTAPGVSGQADLIARAHALANVTPEEIGYIEAHGTGTKLGDAIEIAALTEVFRRSTEEKNFCGIGSVKTNIGHLDAAAGIAGLIKTSMSLKKGIIPASLHFHEPNPELELDESPFFVVNSSRPWADQKKPHVAGVSSFGMGGTNAHVILQQHSTSLFHREEKKWHLFPLSARTPSARDHAVNNLSAFLKQEQVRLTDAAFTLQKGRRHFKHRFYAIADSHESLLAALESGADSVTGCGVAEEQNPSLVFMFSGQGAQYPGMIRELYENKRIIKDVLDRARTIVMKEEGEDLFAVLFPENDQNEDVVADKLMQTRIAQPALVAVEYAMAQLLQSFGVKPAACMGHSIGEYTAAAVCGVIEFEQCIKIVARRGAIMQQMEKGGMLAVSLSPEKLTQFLVPGLSVALHNAPQMSVVAGPLLDIERWEKQISDKGVKCRRIKTSHAFHTPMMREAAKQLADFLNDVEMHAPTIPLLSNVTGGWFDPAGKVRPDYWANHVRMPVRFSDNASAALDSGYRVFVEIGPGNSLCTLLNLHSSEKNLPICIPTIRHAKDKVADITCFMKALGDLWVNGAVINWSCFYFGSTPYRTPLPLYPFERKSYWIGRHGASEKAGTVGKIADCPSLSENTEDGLTKGSNGIAATSDKDMKRLVSRAWDDVLRVGQCDADTDFNSLGGNSLMLAQVAARLNAALPIDVPLSALFDSPTINMQVNLLMNAMSNANSKKPEPALSRIQRDGMLPLSPAQQRLWYICRLEPDSPAFNLVHTFHIKGALNREYLQKAVDLIVERHESLRMVFDHVDGTPYVKVKDTVRAVVNYIDMTASSLDESMQRTSAHIKAEAPRPYDLSHGPLFRWRLYKLSNTEHLLTCMVHHLVSDGWSMSIMLNEIEKSYSALCMGQKPDNKELEIGYADYAEWMNRYVEHTDTTQEREFWSDYFKDGLPILQLPTDYVRPDHLKYTGGLVRFHFDSALTTAIHTYADTHNVNTFSILLGLYGILLNRYSRQKNIVIGCPSANRIRLEFEPVIGLFLNMIPLRIDLTTPADINAFILNTHADIKRAFTHSRIQFGSIVEALKPRRLPNYSPVFQTMFAYNNYSFNKEKGSGVQYEPTIADRGASEYDLSLYMWEIDGVIRGALEYSDELFNESTIRQMASRFKSLIRNALSDPFCDVNHLPLYTSDEKKALAAEHMSTNVEYPREKPVFEHFKEHMLSNPSATAITDGKHSLNYGDLNTLSDTLCGYLLSQGVKKGHRVGIHMGRTIEILPALLGVMKTGAAYVPLDPMFPSDRIDYMVADASINVVVSDSKHAQRFESCQRIKVIRLDTLLKEGKLPIHSNCKVGVSGGDCVYVLYTSGSTGKPKGVEIQHRALSNFLLSMKEQPGITSDDILLAVTTISFDISGLELYLPLLAGACIHLVDNETVADGFKLKKVIESSSATILQATPATFRMLLDAGWRKAKGIKILCGGEALTRELANRILETGAELWNMYGPTETTIWSSISRVCPGDNAPDIGMPIANTQLYILDEHLQEVPSGVVGELYIGGDGLASGYLNKPELTSQRFLTINENGGEQIVYKTGDLVRKRHGRIEFLGRSDRQVKIRGFRIELEEIEICLNRYSDVEQGVIATYEAPTGAELVAYVKPYRGCSPAKSQIRKHLAQTLPGYMIPGTIVFLNEFPLTPNGKIDRNRLPAPEERKGDVNVKSEESKSLDHVDRQLIQIWERVLGKKNIQVTDDYFDLGGNSLGATRLFALIEKQLGVNLPLSTLYHASSIESLADLIRNNNWMPSWKSLVPIQPKGTKPPLFLIHGAGGNVLLYRSLSRRLGDNYPVYGLQSRGLNDAGEAFKSIEEMAALYIEEIRQFYPQGPYLIAGYCMGGLLAFEAARQLMEQGHEVGFVGLMSSAAEPLKLNVPAKIRYFADNVIFHVRNILQADMAGKKLFISERAAEAARRIKVRTAIAATRMLHTLRIRKGNPLVHIEKLNDLAAEHYIPHPYRGVVTLFKPRGSERYASSDAWGWDKVDTKGVDIVNLKAFQNGILIEPFVDEMAHEVRRRIDRIESGGKYIPDTHIDTVGIQVK